MSVAVWLAMWALYLSIVNVGQTFYGFGWETLLLEAGFLAILLGPAGTAPPHPGAVRCTAGCCSGSSSGPG